MSGLSAEFIIHPGETLKEILEDREMSQKELAIRTDVTQAHVSKVINGQKGVSVQYAKKLEYALAIDSSFWINLQSNYEREVEDFKELNNVSEREFEILKQLKEPIKYFKENSLIEPQAHGTKLVIATRKLLNVSNLERIPDIVQIDSYRIAQALKIDTSLLSTWLKDCDLISENQNEENT
ncbi:MAG: HigA family addiction module antitoxin [Sphaerochaetaceae bacterium]